jgi:carbamoyl-phosphate synthase large subunit
MGVHTGDSITVAPAMTLSDREYQAMRDQALRCIRAIGVETGGSNVQFAVHPDTGDMRIIEMNPRVSRSSALASKATGFPIARVAAKLALGYTLDEIPTTSPAPRAPRSSPSIDYVVVKIPRWDFEKFRGAADVLACRCARSGEAMAIGRSFREALQKGLRSLEIGLRASTRRARTAAARGAAFAAPAAGDRSAREPRPERRRDRPRDRHRSLVPARVAAIGATRRELRDAAIWCAAPPRRARDAKRSARRDCSSAPSATASPTRRSPLLSGSQLGRDARWREALDLRPVYKVVDTCAGEFAARTPYYYGTYEQENESARSDRRRVVVSGRRPEPHRPGHRVRLLLRAGGAAARGRATKRS